MIEDDSFWKIIILFGRKSVLILKKNWKPKWNLWWWSKDFYDKEIPTVDSNHTCLGVISLDSALKKDENYYFQVFLNDCKDDDDSYWRIVVKNT